MSTYEYRPNGAGTKPIYDIGTVGIETNYTAIKSSEVSLEASRWLSHVD